MARALVLAAALFLSSNAMARAADPQGYYTIQGVGVENCEVWLGERLSDGPTAWYHQQWVLGYITAFNRWVHEGNNVAVNIGTEKLFEWLDAPIRRVTSTDTFVGYAPTLENATLPQVDDIAEAIVELASY